MHAFKRRKTCFCVGGHRSVQLTKAEPPREDHLLHVSVRGVFHVKRLRTPLAFQLTRAVSHREKISVFGQVLVQVRCRGRGNVFFFFSFFLSP